MTIPVQQIRTTGDQPLVPTHVHLGFGGRLNLGAGLQGAPGPFQRRMDGDLLLLESPGVCLQARGDVDQASSRQGWEVVAFGAARCARAVADVLDQMDERGVRPERDGVPADLARELAWKMLPSALVLAYHRSRGEVYLLRDGAGFIPVYYTLIGTELYFSTNLGAVRRHASSDAVNTDKISEMLVFGHRTGRRTIWQDIRSVGPGDLLILKPNAAPRYVRVWTPEALFEQPERQRLERQSLEDTLSEVEGLVNRALEPVLDQSDEVLVPCGGGVDSSFLGAYLAKKGKKVTYWCTNQIDAAEQERAWMEPLSRRTGIPCRYLHLDRRQFLEELVSASAGCEQPLTGPNAVGARILRNLSFEAGGQSFVIGEQADTLFGGLASFAYVHPAIRLLRRLAGLPLRVRTWLSRGMLEETAWLLTTMQVAHGRELATLGLGDLERAEAIQESQGFSYRGQNNAQRTADLLTWTQFRTIMSRTHHDFYERDEFLGGRTLFPFAHPGLMRFGLHLPHYLKYRHGHKKWLWRHFTSRYTGKTVAFRSKNSYPTPTEKWLARGEALLPNGFLEELLCVDVRSLYDRLPRGDAARWTLMNVELWGRLHCRHEEPGALLHALI